MYCCRSSIVEDTPRQKSSQPIKSFFTSLGRSSPSNSRKNADVTKQASTSTPLTSSGRDSSPAATNIEARNKTVTSKNSGKEATSGERPKSLKQAQTSGESSKQKVTKLKIFLMVQENYLILFHLAFRLFKHIQSNVSFGEK